MTPYILKSSLSLLIMFGLYWFLLRKEKLFAFNRFFLIISIILSLIIPFISISNPINFQNNEIQKDIVTALKNTIPEFSVKQNTFAGTTSQTHTFIVPSKEGFSSELIF